MFIKTIESNASIHKIKAAATMKIADAFGNITSGYNAMSVHSGHTYLVGFDKRECNVIVSSGANAYKIVPYYTKNVGAHVDVFPKKSNGEYSTSPILSVYAEQTGDPDAQFNDIACRIKGIIDAHFGMKRTVIVNKKYADGKVVIDPSYYSDLFTDEIGLDSVQKLGLEDLEYDEEIEVKDGIRIKRIAKDEDNARDFKSIAYKRGFYYFSNVYGYKVIEDHNKETSTFNDDNEKTVIIFRGVTNAPHRSEAIQKDAAYLIDAIAKSDDYELIAVTDDYINGRGIVVSNDVIGDIVIDRFSDHDYEFIAKVEETSSEMLVGLSDTRYEDSILFTSSDDKAFNVFMERVNNMFGAFKDFIDSPMTVFMSVDKYDDTYEIAHISLNGDTRHEFDFTDVEDEWQIIKRYPNKSCWAEAKKHDAGNDDAHDGIKMQSYDVRETINNGKTYYESVITTRKFVS